MKRTNELLSLYEKKNSILVGRGCSSDLNSALLSFKVIINNIQESGQLIQALTDREYLEAQNNLAECKLW